MTFHPALRTGHNPRLARIAGVSRALSWLTLFLMIAGPAAIAGLLLFDPSNLDRMLIEGLSTSGKASLTPVTRVLAILLALVPVGLVLAALFFLRRLFQGFARGAALAPESGQRLKWIGIILAAFAPMTIVIGTLGSIVVSWANAPGEREVSIGLHTDNITVLVFGMLLVVLGWILEEAAIVADENRQFV
ncbi:DUF2975 domain-containing protein [Stappia sp. MMSF_3263]|uniref:DUF2975 domain-containing protein n=1 Tax=Stappia sp. MMSF_3263 TaxID=3046693 RepID=UPI00273D3037|nr:DUF2975 domain-containing protein [Stappia sp. MMSF_3263]